MPDGSKSRRSIPTDDINDLLRMVVKEGKSFEKESASVEKEGTSVEKRGRHG
jgi:hypothetical protein